jgi:tRNA-Thr(GGU) m(6)t(6)A37 methyltransferase TsaA
MKNRVLTLRPIGVIHSPFKDVEGTPIQPRMANSAIGTVEILPEYVEGLRDLEGFERIWLIYWFDRSGDAELRVTPFRDTEERGLFATRAPCRPNPVGISSVKLLSIDGATLKVEDVDILDGTPLLDIKPYVPAFDVFKTSKDGWLDRKASNREQADSRFAQESGKENSDR